MRGKKWVPPPRDAREIEAEEQIAIDMGEEYEHALNDATQEEIIDLAAILGFHSMMNQDQYHASLLNKGQPVGLGWDGITKSTQQKLFPMDPPNSTDVEESIKRVKDDDSKLIDLNLNNIKVCTGIYNFVNLFHKFVMPLEHLGREARTTVCRTASERTSGSPLADKCRPHRQDSPPAGRGHREEQNPESIKCRDQLHQSARDRQAGASPAQVPHHRGVQGLQSGECGVES